MLQELLRDTGYRGVELVADLVAGVPAPGPLPVTGVFPKDVPATADLRLLLELVCQERGAGRGTGCNLNLPLPRGNDWRGHRKLNRFFPSGRGKTCC